jgi:hypothetical protein
MQADQYLEQIADIILMILFPVQIFISRKENRQGYRELPISKTLVAAISDSEFRPNN